MLLALLMVLSGGPGGPLAVLVFEADRSMDAGPGANLPSDPPGLAAAGAEGDDVKEPIGRPAGPPGGALARPRAADAGGGGVEAAERAVALGGGGVAVFAALSSVPPFLLIQRFCSGS